MNLPLNHRGQHNPKVQKMQKREALRGLKN